MRTVAVFGSSLAAEGSEDYESARGVGREIARRGAMVLCGGYGGVMEAASRGASEGGGESVGIVLPGGGAPNRWLTRAEPVADLSERLRRLRDGSDAAIVLPRGLGTLLEIAWVAESIVKGHVRPRPVVFLGEFWRPIASLALAEASSPEGAERLRASLSFADTAAEAVESALSGPFLTPGRGAPGGQPGGERW